MKQFKNFDAAAQTLLVAISIMAMLSPSESFNPLPWIMAFAGVQVLSLLVHVAAGKALWKMTSWRRIHGWGLLLVLLALLVAIVQDDMARTGDKDDKYSMAGLGIVVWASIPAVLLSLFYVVITWVEWTRLRKK